MLPRDNCIYALVVLATLATYLLLYALAYLISANLFCQFYCQIFRYSLSVAGETTAIATAGSFYSYCCQFDSRLPYSSSARYALSYKDGDTSHQNASSSGTCISAMQVLMRV